MTCDGLFTNTPRTAYYTPYIEKAAILERVSVYSTIVGGVPIGELQSSNSLPMLNLVQVSS
jgi:hypothetical protein